LNDVNVFLSEQQTSFSPWYLGAEPDLGVGGPGKFLLEGPYDVFHDVIVCEFYVFVDLQRFRLLFPVVDYVLAVLTRLLAAFGCKLHEIMSKINVSCP